MLLAIVVLVHFAIVVLHGASHVGGAVAIGPTAMAFVILVIQIGPLAGLVVTRWRPVAGAVIVAVTLAGSLVFGVVNHFLIHGTDHVSHVPPAWRLMFGSTAVLLAVTEAAGVGVAARAIARARPSRNVRVS